MHRLSFGLPVMRPNRLEAPGAILAEPEAVQIFEAAGIIGIALDVVEDVAFIGLGQQIEAAAELMVAKLEAGCAAIAPRRLQARLDLEASLSFACELGHQPDAGCRDRSSS